jgi:hypothetical protein
MLSKLESIYDLDYNVMGEVVEKIQNPQIGTEIKLYIPRVMQNITKGEPMEYVSSVSYNGCFANAEACKPKLTSNTFTEQNFLVAKLENSTDLKPLMDYLRTQEGELAATYIDVGKQIRCYFKNGKFQQLRLNTDDSLTNQSSDIEVDYGPEGTT